MRLGVITIGGRAWTDPVASDGGQSGLPQCGNSCQLAACALSWLAGWRIPLDRRICRSAVRLSQPFSGAVAPDGNSPARPLWRYARLSSSSVFPTPVHGHPSVHRAVRSGDRTPSSQCRGDFRLLAYSRECLLESAFGDRPLAPSSPVEIRSRGDLPTTTCGGPQTAYWLAPPAPAACADRRLQLSARQ